MSLARVTALTLALVGTGVYAAEDQLEIRASLSGYNLLWPTSRCCAFDLHIANDGTARVVTKVNNGKKPAENTRTFRLSSEELTKLRKTVEEVQFFSLPVELRCGAIHADERRLTVRLGAREHHVAFSEDATDKQRELYRAFTLWRAVRATFVIPGENVK